MSCIKENIYAALLSQANNKTYYNLLLYDKNYLKLNSAFDVFLKLHDTIF